MIVRIIHRVRSRFPASRLRLGRRIWRTCDSRCSLSRTLLEDERAHCGRADGRRWTRKRRSHHPGEATLTRPPNFCKKVAFYQRIMFVVKVLIFAQIASVLTPSLSALAQSFCACIQQNTKIPSNIWHSWKLLSVLAHGIYRQNKQYYRIL